MFNIYEIAEVISDDIYMLGIMAAAWMIAKIACHSSFTKPADNI